MIYHPILPSESGYYNMTLFYFLHTFLLSMFSFITLMLFIHIIWIAFQSKTKKNLPPSPWKLPIIGNFHQLGSNLNQSLQAMSQKHGSIMLLHFGSVPMLVASSSEVAEAIMKTQDLSFASRPNLPIPSILTYGSRDIAFSPYGEEWRQLKSIVVVHLLGNARVKSFKQVREEEVSGMIDMLGESCGCLVDIRLLLNSLTNRIICKVTLGKTYDVSRLVDLLTQVVEMFDAFSLGTYIPWLWWVDQVSGLERRAKRVATEIGEFFEGVIDEHVNKKKRVLAESDDSKDLVDILLDIQREKTTGFTFGRDFIKAIILDMFTAGTETTSTSLEWTLCELIKHPRTMKKLQQEVTEIAQGKSMINEDDLEKMHYLKAVVKESLRLHPSIPLLLPRISRHDVKLMGYDIPSHTQVLVNAWAIGRDPAQWEEANEFRPERFLNKSIDYKGINFDWIPFGAGRRGCPGIQFSVVIMELALANIVYKFNFALPNGLNCEDLDMSETCRITLHRKSPLKVLPSSRF